jgi:hypothetical protein
MVKKMIGVYEKPGGADKNTPIYILSGYKMNTVVKI